MYKVVKNLVHSRQIGKDSEGKDNYISTQIGCIMSNDDGKMIMKLNYQAPLGDIINLYDPKKKEVPEETPF